MPLLFKILIMLLNQTISRSIIPPYDLVRLEYRFEPGQFRSDPFHQLINHLHLLFPLPSPPTPSLPPYSPLASFSLPPLFPLLYHSPSPTPPRLPLLPHPPSSLSSNSFLTSSSSFVFYSFSTYFSFSSSTSFL